MFVNVLFLQLGGRYVSFVTSFLIHFSMPETLHRSSLITWSEWSLTFFALREDANSSSSPKKLPYCQYRILFFLLIWPALAPHTLWREMERREILSSAPHLQARAPHLCRTSAQPHQPLTTTRHTWSHPWTRSWPASPSQDPFPQHFGNLVQTFKKPVPFGFKLKRRNH